MGIITPKSPIPSIGEMSQDRAIKDRAERINTMASDGLELLKNYVIEKEIKTEDMEFFIDAVHKKYQAWAGSIVNSLTVNQLLDLKGDKPNDDGKK